MLGLPRNNGGNTHDRRTHHRSRAPAAWRQRRTGAAKTKEEDDGYPDEALDLNRAIDAIRYIRHNDCDLLTIDTVRTYTGASPQIAAAALITEIGMGWFMHGLARELERYGWDQIPGQALVATGDGQIFAVVPGRAGSGCGSTWPMAS